MTTPSYQLSLYQVKAQRILRDQASVVLSAYNLTATEWTIIGQIYEHKDGIRLSELANILGVEAPLITNLVDTLAKKTIVQKHPHPRDRRAKLLFLTKKGIDLLPQVEEEVQQKIGKALKGASEEEQHTYLKVLMIIVKNATA